MECPGSPSAMHAACQLQVHFPSASCDRVRAEVEARIAAGPSFDAHNHGNYSLLSSDASALLGQRITGTGCLGCYTDRFKLTLQPIASPVGCTVYACSESQGQSYTDYSTNYCNLHLLWCNAHEGCPFIVDGELAYTEDVVECSAGGAGTIQQHDASQCTPDISTPTLPSPPAAPVIFSPSAPPSPASPPRLPATRASGLSATGNSPGATILFTCIFILSLIALVAFGIVKLRRMLRRHAAEADRQRRATAALGVLRGRSSTHNRATDVLDEEEEAGEWELNDAAKAAKVQDEANAQAAPAAAAPAAAAPAGSES